MSYPAYPDYAAARWPEVGQIPTGWEARRLKFAATCNDEALPETTDPDFEMAYVDISSVSLVNGITNVENQTFEKAPSRARRMVRHGDTIISTVRTYLKAIAPVESPPENMIVSTGFAVIRPLEVIDSGFLGYALQSTAFIDAVVAHSTGVGYPAINPTTLVGLPGSYPEDKKEQQHIAAFLDWKTGQIDALIAKKQALMDKLKEKRLAVITQTVTKGLNPTAPLRDSGVTWLGLVPEQWEIKPVKFLTRIVRGQFSHRPRNDPAFYNGEYPFIQTGDIARAGKYVTTYSQTLNERGLSVSRQFPSGTLVMTIAANIGDMAIIQFPACFPDSIVGFIPEPDIDLNFLYYMFVAMKQRLMMTAVLNTQLNLNIDRIASIEAIAPPAKEQKAIVEYLDKTEARIQLLMAKAESAIAHLTEYRTALITAATTGQIDVRQVIIPASTRQLLEEYLSVQRPDDMMMSLP